MEVAAALSAHATSWVYGVSAGLPPEGALSFPSSPFAFLVPGRLPFRLKGHIYILHLHHLGFRQSLISGDLAYIYLAHGRNLSESPHAIAAVTAFAGSDRGYLPLLQGEDDDDQ